MPIPLALIGAGITAAGKIGSIAARELSPEGQALARQAKEDEDKLKKNEFGPGRAEQERTVQDALQMVRAQSQSARDEATRQSAAQGFKAGTDGLATQRIADTASKQAGALRMGAANTAAQQAAQMKRDALDRVKTRAKQTEADVAGVFGAAADVAMAGNPGEDEDLTGIVDGYAPPKTTDSLLPKTTKKLPYSL